LKESIIHSFNREKRELENIFVGFNYQQQFCLLQNHSGGIKGASLALFIFLCIYCKKYIFAPD
jgi:hypothetical protein